MFSPQFVTFGVFSLAREAFSQYYTHTPAYIYIYIFSYGKNFIFFQGLSHNSKHLMSPKFDYISDSCAALKF